MKSESRRILALLLLFVTITGLVVSFGENVLCAGERPGTHETADTSRELAMAQPHDSDCPCGPLSPHAPSDHFCAGDCGCPCNAPLTSPALTFTYSRSYTYLYPAEITRHIPEVYLSLFVPPDSTAV
jgi:hypothetical protein